MSQIRRNGRLAGRPGVQFAVRLAIGGTIRLVQPEGKRGQDGQAQNGQNDPLDHGGKIVHQRIWGHPWHARKHIPGRSARLEGMCKYQRGWSGITLL